MEEEEEDVVVVLEVMEEKEQRENGDETVNEELKQKYFPESERKVCTKESTATAEGEKLDLSLGKEEART